MGSNLLHPHTVRVRGERLEIVEIRSQRGAIGLRERHDQSVDSRTATRSSAQQGRAPRQRFGNIFHDIAGLQEAIGKRVAASMTVQALHEDNGRNDRRPEVLLPQRED